MLDNDRGDSDFLDLPDNFFNFLNNDRRQPLIGLIQQKQFDIAGQCPGDGQHLLLTARQRGAHLRAPFGKPWKMFVNAFQLPAARFCNLRQDQIFFNRQATDDPPVFGNKLNTHLRCLIGFLVMQAFTTKINLTAFQRRIIDPGDRPKRRGFTGAIAAQQRQNFTLVQLQ